MNEKNALMPLIQFGTLSVKRLPYKVELIDHSGDRIALVLFSNYDYSNGGALALERANAIADACNSHDALVAERDRLEATCADLCLAVTGDPLLGQRLDIDLAMTVRSVAHQAMQKLLAGASDDATKLEARCDALVAALEKYGTHEDDCEYQLRFESAESYIEVDGTCSCGYSAALKASQVQP